MKLKVTAIVRYAALGDWRVTYRREVQWADDKPWLDLGCSHCGQSEFGLQVYLLAAGARALGIDFIYLDFTIKQPIAKSDLDNLETKILTSLKEFVDAN